MKTFLPLVLSAVVATQAYAADLPETHLKVVGSVGSAASYRDFEKPFFSEELAKDSNGKVTAEIRPFTEMGLKGGEILRLVKQGVIQYGATIMAYMSSDDPVNEAIDLAGLTTDYDSARAVTEAYKPYLSKVYNDKFDAKLLGLWPNPAQVLYCKGNITGLKDLKGKKVRTSSRTQAEFVDAMGGTGVTMAFGEVVPALQNGVVDCAITSTLSGNLAKWYEVSDHIVQLPIAWNQIVLVVGNKTWNSTDPKVQQYIETKVKSLEDRLWADVKYQTEQGYDCNQGLDSCKLGSKGAMTLVKASDEDKALLHKTLVGEVVPKWAARSTKESVDAWNATVGKIVDVQAAK
ncbi:TRAP transporter substrate-binding protein [Pokkaliibacter sp. CJK22405]|uniref:TRAP transporter substrate-binding protein n=1 Tax=Pokkaliibacter sp. CJK22405 TaxID=3384615 RepID=UPI003984B274